jgi:hypothetical protein
VLNNQQIEKNWPQIKSQVLSKWNKLSDSDVERTHGSLGSLAELVHTKYGKDEDFDTAYERICESCVSSSRKGERGNARTDFSGSDFTGRDTTSPSGEAGLPKRGTVKSDDNSFQADSLNRRAGAEYEKNAHDNQRAQGFTPPEFYPSQDPTPAREDVKASKNSARNEKSEM